MHAAFMVSHARSPSLKGRAQTLLSSAKAAKVLNLRWSEVSGVLGKECDLQGEHLKCFENDASSSKTLGRFYPSEF